jgi:hypothetical protein
MDLMKPFLELLTLELIPRLGGREDWEIEKSKKETPK